jgi:hypothetical protein
MVQILDGNLSSYFYPKTLYYLAMYIYVKNIIFNNENQNVDDKDFDNFR